MNNRRRFLFGAALAGPVLAGGKAPTILLRSGWQSVNIGDITHTPGALTLIGKVIPAARVILWPNEIDRGVEPMLLRRFPRLSIAKGGLGADGRPDTAELRDAFAAADLCIHGSAPSVISPERMEAWHSATRKPYGFLGIGFTLGGEPAGAKGDARLRALLGGAKFVYTRETASLQNLTQARVSGPRLGFCPDSTFSFDIRDDATGDAFLRAEGLEPGKFIAAIPRLRLTPYHLIRKASYGQEEIQRRTRINDKWAEADHAKLREAIVAYVRKTGGKVLLCPEMTYQLDIIGPLLFTPLPEDVKPKVVCRKSYWLPDEAASIYARAAAVVSFECHSPIIAASAGTPCIYLHQPEDGIKGRMYPDLGLADWYFEIESSNGQAIAERVLDIAAHPRKAARKLRSAVTYARSLQAKAFSVARQAM